jgi:hypothetical protein
LWILEVYPASRNKLFIVLHPYFFPIPDPGFRVQRGTGSQILDPDVQYRTPGSGFKSGPATLELFVTLRYFSRHEDVAESIQELEVMKEMGEQFPESGHLLKLVGVLRAGDIYWNPGKR